MRTAQSVQSHIMLALFLAAGTLPAACGSDEQASMDDAAHVAPLDTAVLNDSFSGPPDEPDEADTEEQPDRVYYVLTNYDWYARGEPLVLDGTAYTASGNPLRLDAAALVRVAEYGGVDVYRRDGDARAYVPVFEGYWLGFEPDPSAPLPPTADATAGTQTPDTLR